MAKTSGTSLLKGLVNRSPAGDGIAKPMGGSVNNDTTRSSTAPNPSTLGPRVA